MMNHTVTPLQEANAMLKSGQYKKAIRIYSDLLSLYPDLKSVISFNLNFARQKQNLIEPEPISEKKDYKNNNEDEVNDDFFNLAFKDVSEIGVVTFDIWDTVLRRRCDPDEVKLRTARALWLLHPNNANSKLFETPVNLYWLRKDAERNVADEHYEYKINDVLIEWIKLCGIKDASLIDSYSVTLLKSELNVECAVTKPDETIHKLLNNVSNKRIIAISDFYHTSESLSKILDSHGLKLFFNKIYVSCDWMKTKREGSLYDVVINEEKLDTKSFIHIGDNPHADHAVANAKGINSILYKNNLHEVRNNKLKQTFEEYLEGNCNLHYTNILDSIDSGLDEMGDIKDLKKAGKLLSPLVIGFVMYCMQEAIRRRVPNIFFFAREGIFFKKVYEEIVKMDVFDIGLYPKPEIVYVSRRATFAASLDQLSLDEMMRMWNMYSTQSINAMSRSLNFDVDLVSAIARKFSIDPEQPIQYPWLNEKFKDFFHSSDFQSYAVPLLKHQKKNLVNHLESVGFKPDENIDRVIVDIGWRGTIQDNVCNLTKGNVHGVYLALKKFLNYQPKNSTKSGYLSDDNISDEYDFGEVAALEFIFNAAGGSCVGYSDDGFPQREIIPGEEIIIDNQVASIQEGVLDGVTTLGEYIKCHGLIAEDIRVLAKDLVMCYSKNPPTCIADSFSNLEHNETFGTGDADQMSHDANLSRILKLEDAELHSSLTQLLVKQRWPTSLFNTSEFKKIFNDFSPSQKLNIPCVGVRENIFSIIRQETRRNIVSIITPPPLAGSGGHRTIYNFAKGIAREGFEVHLMLEGVNDDLWYVEQEIAGHSITLHKEWFAGIRPQVAIATIAHSAKYVREFFPDSVGGYFVQDYEAEFNPLSDGYVRGQNSYAQGLSPICIGHWLPHVLRKQFGIGASYGGLGVDNSVYFRKPNVEKKDMVAFLYQPEKWRRMPETCIAALAIVKQRRPHTEIVLYGSNSQPYLPFDATQRGLIHDLSELNQIYNEASVGLCLSLTNPSRIPIEYMAAGCVPVDLYRYNNLFDNPTGTSLLAYQSESSIAEAILKLLENKDECERRSLNGIALAQQRSLNWEVDTASNAVRWLLSGASIDEIQTPICTYQDDPIISSLDKTREVLNFCKWQKDLASNIV